MKTAINVYIRYLKELLILAFPMFIGSLGHTLIGATDVLIIAKYNIKSLAAVSIANSIFFTIMILGLGILTAVSIILSNLRGAKQKTKKYLLSTLILSIILALIFSLLSYLSAFIIPHLKLEAELVPYIQEYIYIVSVSMFGIFIFEGIKQFLQSYEIVKLPNYLQLSSVLLNLIADIVFVFGFGIIPSMGSKGAAIATLTVRMLMALILYIYVFRFIKFKSPVDFSYMKTIVKTGTPIGIALLFEFSAFNIITVLAGIESSIYAAVHSILITIASATFMIPFAISTALSVKVAYWFGAKKPEEVKIYSYTALYTVLGFMSLISLILAVFPKEIISFFTSDNKVMTVALPLISIVAAYQIFDGFQCVTGGILKGFKLTKTVTLTVLTGYWIIGASVAYILVSKYAMSLRGYWFALAISLFSMGFIQAVIAKKYYKKILTGNI